VQLVAPLDLGKMHVVTALQLRVVLGVATECCGEQALDLVAHLLEVGFFTHLW
jgi:hypothetical protein